MEMRKPLPTSPELEMSLLRRIAQARGSSVEMVRSPNGGFMLSSGDYGRETVVAALRARGLIEFHPAPPRSRFSVTEAGHALLAAPAPRHFIPTT